MTDARATWQEVADRLEALALKLKLHGEEELSEEGRGDSTLERLVGDVRAAVTAVGDAALDPAVRADICSAADAFGRAMTETFEEARHAQRSPF